MRRCGMPKAPEKEQAVEMESISSRLGRTTVELSEDLARPTGTRCCIKDFTYIFPEK